jgi:hypothetical protein
VMKARPPAEFITRSVMTTMEIHRHRMARS